MVSLAKELNKVGVKADMTNACQNHLCRHGGCDNPSSKYCVDCYCSVCIKADPKHCQPIVVLGKSNAVQKEHTPAKRKAPEATPDGHTWNKQPADLKKGDILRTKVGNQDHEMYGQYIYGVCTGEGNGCCSSGMGNAIFVHHVGFDLDKVIPHTGDKESNWERWERFWGINVFIK